MEWGQQGEITYMRQMRSQLVASRAVAEVLADIATGARALAPGSIVEVAGPREENIVDAATLLAARRSDGLKVEGVHETSPSTREVFEGGGLLPGPDAILVGPTFGEWLESC
jgi:hypothetical protein